MVQMMTIMLFDAIIVVRFRPHHPAVDGIAIFASTSHRSK
jgi:hypothetical protein